MTGAFYVPGDSLLHKRPAGEKIIALMIVCSGVFLVDSLLAVAIVAAAVVLLLLMAGISLLTAAQQLRPVLYILLIIFIVQTLVVDVPTASKIIGRFAVLILAAALVTFTTRSSAMLAALQVGIQPFARFGVNPAKVSLALSLAIRFIPSIATLTQEVREAQRVRGLERSVFAVAVPTIVRTLKMADEIADAIDARCFDAER